MRHYPKKLNALGMGVIAASLESFLGSPERDEESLADSLHALIDIEYTARKERAARTRIKISGMPTMKELDDFDVSCLKGGMTKQKLAELKSLAFIDGKKTLYCLGRQDWGKPISCLPSGVMRV